MFRKLKFYVVLSMICFGTFPVISQTVMPGDAKFGVPVSFWSNIYSIDISKLPNQGASLAYRDAYSYANGLQSRINSSYPAVDVLNSSHENEIVTRSLLTDYAHSANVDAEFFCMHGGNATFDICLPNTVPSTLAMDVVSFGNCFYTAGRPEYIRFGGYSQFGTYNSWTKWAFLDNCENILDPNGNTGGNQGVDKAFDGIHAMVGFVSTTTGKEKLVCVKKFLWMCTKQEWRYTSDKWYEFADLWITKGNTLWDSWNASVRDKIYNDFGYSVEPGILAPTGQVFDRNTNQWVGWNGINERFNSVYSDPTPSCGSNTFRFSSLSLISAVYGQPSY